ncbi:App1 family protein [Quadrisphaera sp. GCM10027208]|uniref:App1 family protein n=1 Tax=Quadrisphaera sp. GCM10027208 TaxID=3273423 RepID=UPI00360E6F80
MTESRAKPHLAAVLEARADAVVEQVLRGRGWVPHVVAYPGYGSVARDGAPGWVRVLGRVLLSRPGTAGRPRRQGLVRGWRSFATAPVAGAHVVVTAGSSTRTVRTNRSGYVDAVVECDLPAGTHEVTLRLPDGEPASAVVTVVGAQQTLGVVSDIDDTVMITSLPRPLIAAWNTFVLHEQARYVVPGMAPLYREIVVRQPGTLVVYLSTGAFNVAPTLSRFLTRHGYPAGPLLLTDWGPTNAGWFRSGRQHKAATLRRLARELPQVRWLLIGDDGQHDPDIYLDFAREYPEHVRGIAIRQLTTGERVLSRGTTGPRPEDHGPAEAPVPEVRAPDGTGLGDALRRAGLL